MRLVNVMTAAVVLELILAGIVTERSRAEGKAPTPALAPAAQPIILDGVRYELRRLGIAAEKNAETSTLEYYWVVTVVVQAHLQKKTIKFGFLSGDPSIPPDRVIWESSSRDGIFYRMARVNFEMVKKALERLLGSADEGLEFRRPPEVSARMI